MESIAQILSSLKENEKSIIVCIIANAFIIYLVCFLGIEQFKTYQWYQQFIVSCSISICYVTAFYFIFVTLLSIFSVFRANRDFCSFMIEGSFKWFLCIFSLGNFSTLTEVILSLTDKNHYFSFNNIIQGTCMIALGIIILLIIVTIVGLFSKNKKVS